MIAEGRKLDQKVSAPDQKVSALDRRDRSLGEKESRVSKNHRRFDRRHRPIDGDDGTILDRHRSLSIARIDRSLPAMER
ncbi:hypothetical protein [Candidatus Accumulibacter sp. ACC003]|jgi:hypothetical protein|uniref:hypothetical protein n=1 Tax=Candidatus Accumulibacter sp. ACC003 TaxID=2823334 RepID=UPI0025C3ECEC|nr:hypothetical protein [Candidatus Accumulibacter sp. ACC003]